MPRIRADDYDDKKTKILNAAASLFAKYGYAGCKMEQIAEHCGVSKSMLYHYFKKKEDVLFEILQQHVLRLIDLVKSYTETSKAKNNVEFFRGLVEVYLEPAKDARAHHVVALHDMRYLTDEQKVKQVKLERDLLKLVSDVLVKIAPNTDTADQPIYPLLLLGMMNWIELWYRRSGKVSPAEFYDRVAHLFLRGYLDPYASDPRRVKPKLK